MSVLTDINISIDNCDIQLLAWRLWDKFIHDELGDIETGIDWNMYCLKHYPTSSNSLKQSIYKNIKDRITYINMHALVKIFNLTVSEIELLCNSDYVREVSKMNWFVWKNNSIGYYTGTATYDSAILYLNTGRATIKESCGIESINGGREIAGEITFQYEIDKDTMLNTQYNLEKQILCAQVIWADNFILSFKDYFFSKMEQFS